VVGRRLEKVQIPKKPDARNEWNMERWRSVRNELETIDVLILIVTSRTVVLHASVLYALAKSGQGPSNPKPTNHLSRTWNCGIGINDYHCEA
jgi:hypothetical protein